MRRLILLVISFVGVACGHRVDAVGDAGGVAGADGGGTPADSGVADAGEVDGGLVVARPYTLHVPTGYDAGQPTPLVVLLHGYGASGAIQESYFKLTPLSDARTFLYAYPDGTIDASGHRFWNATDACCDVYGTGVNDVAYLNAVIDDVERRFNVDRKRVYLVGHSNGAFMAQRMACDSADRIAAIVSLAGAQWKDVSHCRPSSAVAVLDVHGTADTVVPYDGGAFFGVSFPSARETIADWAAFDGCGPPDNSAPNLDIDGSIPGAETAVARFTACDAGAAELWSIQGGAHIPSLVPAWPDDIYAFLSAHPK